MTATVLQQEVLSTLPGSANFMATPSELEMVELEALLIPDGYIDDLTCSEITRCLQEGWVVFESAFVPSSVEFEDHSIVYLLARHHEEEIKTLESVQLRVRKGTDGGYSEEQVLDYISVGWKMVAFTYIPMCEALADYFLLLLRRTRFA